MSKQLFSVKYKKNFTLREILSLEKKYGLKREREIPPLRLYGYSGGDEKLEEILAEPGVEYVEKDTEMGISGDG